MKKKVFGRQLSRDANERKALFKGLLESLVMLESIQTTEAKARAIRAQAEKLVTKAKVRKEDAEKFLQPYLSPKAVEKVITDLAPRFEKRPGGYTRIIKIGNRFADNAKVAIIEWVEKSSDTRIKSQGANKKEDKTQSVVAGKAKQSGSAQTKTAKTTQKGEKRSRKKE